MSHQAFYTVKDVAPADFIREYASHLKKGNKLQIPDFTQWTTTSVAHELAPQDADWVYIRTAAVARKIFLKPHTGVSTLKHIFGSNKDRGNLRSKHQAGFGKILRWALKSLEELKIVKRDKNSASKKLSRVITTEGQTELNRIATQIIQKKLAASQL